MNTCKINLKKDERRKRAEKKAAGEDKASEEESANSNDNKPPKIEDNDERTNAKTHRQHPVFDRKTKIAGNDDFLKQIFS